MGTGLKFAAIDIGSNSVKLLFIQVFEISEKPVLILDAVYKMPLKLGGEIFKTGELSASKTRDFISTLTAYKKLIEVYKPVNYTVQGTSALRDAVNGQEIIQEVKKQTGLDIQIISGEEEARTLLSNYAAIFNKFPKDNFLFVDVGGGSTEFVVISKGRLISQQSFDIGSVRYRDRLVKPDTWIKMELFLESVKSNYRNLKVVGTGGSINEMDRAFQKKKGGEIATSLIETMHDTLRNISEEERIIRYHIRPDRADIIVPAAEIFLFILRFLSSEKIFVPRTGLAHGLVLEMYRKYKENIAG